MVRPDRFELPTFWFVGMQSGRILLIVMPAISSLEANTRRTNAAIDERLMKASSTDRLPNYFCWTPSFPHARRVAVGSRGRPDPEFSRAQEHSPMRLPLRPKRFITRPGRANILGIPGGGFACPTTCDVAASSLPYPCCSFSLPAPPLLRAARPISKIRYFTLRLRSRSLPSRFQRRRPSPGDAFVRPGGFPWRFQPGDHPCRAAVTPPTTPSQYVPAVTFTDWKAHRTAPRAFHRNREDVARVRLGADDPSLCLSVTMAC